MALPLVAAAISLAGAAHADPAPAGAPSPVIRPGHERAVARLLSAPTRPPLPAGWTLSDPQIRRDHIEVALRSPGGPTLTVALHHPTRAAPAAPRPGLPPRLGPFVARYVGTGWRTPPPHTAVAVRALGAALAQRASAAEDLWSAPRRNVLPTASAPVNRAADEVAHWAADPLVWLAVWLALLCTLAAYVIAAAPRSPSRRREALALAAALAAVTALALVWRLLLSPHAPMTAWSWSRESPIPLALSRGPVVHAWAAHLASSAAPTAPLWFDDLVSWTHLGFAVLTPLALFVHGAALLRSPVAGLLAALLVAASPHHVRFSASDVVFVPSLFLSASTFAALYGAVRPPKGRAWLRWASALAFAPLLWHTLAARPLNLLFAPLCLGAVALAVREPDGRARDAAADPRADAATRAVVAWLVAVVAVAASVRAWLLGSDQGDAVAAGLSLETLTSAVALLARPSHNPLLAWRWTPPMWTPLMLWGALTLWRQDRDRAVFLGCWLFGFVVAHGAVVPENPDMNARYQLHALAPMALLAAAGLQAMWRALAAEPAPELPRRPRRWALVAGVVVVGVLASAPLQHRDAIADTRGFLQRERALANRLRAVVPPRCVVLERLRPASGEREPRALRVARHVGSGGPTWTSMTLSSPAPAGDDPTRAPGESTWNPAVDAVLADPGRCVAFLENIACHGARVGPGRDPLCARLLRSAPWRQVAELRTPMLAWDSNHAGHLRADGEHVVLRIWLRVPPRDAPPAAATATPSAAPTRSPQR